MVKEVNEKLVHGFGINDADYVVAPSIDGAQVWCPFYLKWRNMVVRAYSDDFQVKWPTYKGVTICEEWRHFSKFKTWMEQHDWEDKHLDKDILVSGNTIYSPDTCCFVSPRVNTFLTDSRGSRGEYAIGVYWDKSSGRFKARCCNPFTGKREHIGYFEDELEASLAWKARKHKFACMLADLETDQRIAKALRERYVFYEI